MPRAGLKELSELKKLANASACQDQTDGRVVEGAFRTEELLDAVQKLLSVDASMNAMAIAEFRLSKKPFNVE
jgi:hypothetical protein